MYRARGFALRDVFPDVLMGITIAEEMDGTTGDDGRIIDITPTTTAPETTAAPPLIEPKEKVAAPPPPPPRSPMAPPAAPDPEPTGTVDQKDLVRLFAKMGDRGIPREEFALWARETFGIKSRKDIPKSKLPECEKWIETWKPQT